MDTARNSIASDGRSRATLLVPLPQAEHEASDGLRLAACSICLHVLSSAGWIEAERMIQMLRWFERGSPPRLAPVVCPRCEESIRRRRALASEPLAA
jgi:hypothetical protein